MSAAGPPPHCRLTCLLARDASKAVIFRRGPSKRTCLIAWDRADDSFEVGQWFRGSVYPERSGLSPDGAWLLVFMGNFRAPFATWTVLSRPPWFTAVALWPKGDTWGGGGFFLDRRSIVLRNHDALAPALGGVPARFGVVRSTSEVESRAAASDQWRTEGGDWRGPYRRRTDRAVLTFAWESELRGWNDLRVFTLAVGRRTIPLAGVDWADFDRNGDLLFARGGGLYRLAEAAFDALEGDTDAVQAARRLIDLTDLRFRALAAPYGGTRAPSPDASEPGGEGGAEDYAPPLDRVGKEDRRLRRRLRRAGGGSVPRPVS